MRAELNSIQQQAMNSLGGISSIGNSPDIQALEKELASLRTEFQVRLLELFIFIVLSFFLWVSNGGSKFIASLNFEAARATTISRGASPNLSSLIRKEGDGRETDSFL